MAPPTAPLSAAAAAATATPIGGLALSSLPLQITVGCLCASYWRGAWYVLDYTLYPHDRLKSGLVSLGAGGTLLGMKQYILSPSYNGSKALIRLLAPRIPRSVSVRTALTTTNRFISLYVIAMSCVLVWRGTWLLWDEASDLVADRIAAATAAKEEKDGDEQSEALIPATLVGGGAARPLPTPAIAPPTASLPHNLGGTAPLTVIAATSPDAPGHPHHADHDAVSHHDVDSTLFYSGVASHVAATVGLLVCGRFMAVMAPPANVCMLRDAFFLRGKGRAFKTAARSFVQARP